MRDHGMEMAQRFAQEAAVDAEWHFNYLRTREFTATITDAERVELARLVAEREQATALRSVCSPNVTYGSGSVAEPPRPKGATADDDREREAGGVSRPLFLPNTPPQAVTPVSSSGEESSA